MEQATGIESIASLEGVWGTAIRATELEAYMLLSSRNFPFVIVANDPLMDLRVAVFGTSHGVIPPFPPACSGPSNPQIMEPGRIPPQTLHAGVSGS